MATSSLKIIIARSGTFGVMGRKRTAFVVGPRTSPLRVTYAPEVDCREWSLPPWMSSALLDVPGGELSGRVFDLADLPLSPFAKSLMENDAGSLQIARAALADQSATRRRSDSMIANAVWDLLQEDPHRSIRAVGERLGVSTRRLQQAAGRELGLSPKEIGRLVRHDRAVKMVLGRDLSLAKIAHDAGYADQSHMTREFVEFGAITPARLRKASHHGAKAVP